MHIDTPGITKQFDTFATSVACLSRDFVFYAMAAESFLRVSLVEVAARDTPTIRETDSSVSFTAFEHFIREIHRVPCNVARGAVVL